LVSGPGTTTLRATLPVPGSVDAASRDACAAGAVRRAGPGVDRKPTMSNETGVNAMKAKFSLYALGLATALLCSPAMAGSWGTSGYTGLGFIDEDELDDDAFSSSTSLVWRWNDTLGIEGGYTRFGDFEGDFDTIEGTGKAELGIDGFTLGLNFLSRTGGDWFITGRAGVWAWDSELKVEVPGSARLDLDSDGNDFYIGAGIGYMFSERFGAGLGGTYYSVDVDDSTTGLYIIGVNTTYTF
jgi:OOP family OmpA-OmpF porin/outer membrane immunogenic protein